MGGGASTSLASVPDDVAVSALADELTRDPERVRRILESAEAQVLAAPRGPAVLSEAPCPAPGLPGDAATTLSLRLAAIPPPSSAPAPAAAGGASSDDDDLRGAAPTSLSHSPQKLTSPTSHSPQTSPSSWLLGKKVRGSQP